MSNQHTPGPWYWDSDPVKNDPFDRIRYRVCATGKTATQVYYSSFEGKLTNAEADARLIAAAPELLEALRVMVKNFRSYSECRGDYDVIDQALAAIAKAEGQS